MRVAFIADCHIGNSKLYGGQTKAGINDRCRLTLDALKRAYEEISKDCGALFICGDLFDSSRPEPQVIRAVQEIIARYAEKVTTYILSGNHDMTSDAEGDNALGPLVPVAHVLDQPLRYYVDGGEVWAVPFRTGKAEDWLPRVVNDLRGTTDGAPTPRVLALHLGLQDGATPPWLKGSSDAVTLDSVAGQCSSLGIALVVAGHWHPHRSWSGHDGVQGVDLVQIGALVPTDWRNPGLEGYGTILVWDSKRGNWTKKAISGPRFVTTEEEVLKAPEGCKLFLRLKADGTPTAVAAAQGKLEALAERLGVVGEVVPDTTEAEVALRTAAGVTRSAETAEQAVSDYIAQMPLENEALRPEVKERVTQLLGGAA